MLAASTSAAFCLPLATKTVEQARSHAKSRGISRLSGGCSCSVIFHRKVLASGKVIEKCYVPCSVEAQRKRVEEKLHSLQLYPPGKRLDTNVYIMARNIASEGGSGPGAEVLALGEALVNRAREARKTFAEIALFDDRYFASQYGNNPSVATKANPRWEHIVAAELVLAGQSGGIARGATHYFGPNAFGSTTKTAKEALYKWYDSYSLNWVGYIPGIDVRRQMFFRKGEKDPRRYAEAKAVIDSHSPGWVMSPGECTGPLGAAIALPLAMGALALGSLGAMFWMRKRALRV